MFRGHWTESSKFVAKISCHLTCNASVRCLVGTFKHWLFPAVMRPVGNCWARCVSEQHIFSAPSINDVWKFAFYHSHPVKRNCNEWCGMRFGSDFHCGGTSATLTHPTRSFVGAASKEECQFQVTRTRTMPWGTRTLTRDLSGAGAKRVAKNSGLN